MYNIEKSLHCFLAPSFNDRALFRSVHALPLVKIRELVLIQLFFFKKPVCLTKNHALRPRYTMPGFHTFFNEVAE